MSCCYCDNELTKQEASIPESIICYKAGREDPDNPDNRIVTEWACPVHGVVYSPGGGISMTVVLRGGPWDGRLLHWDVVDKQTVLVDGKEHVYEKGEWLSKYKHEELNLSCVWEFNYKGEK